MSETKNSLTPSGYKLNKTGLIYDPLMLEYHCLWDEIYPEKPDRILKPYERCQFYGLVDKCVRLKGRMSTDEEVESCHTARVNQLMKNMENISVDELKHLSATYDSTYFHQKCDKAARFALGSSIELMDEIMTDKIDNGFAIIRPPGHHAMHDEPNGYCYFNNAAVVAKLAIDKYKLERVLIIDWDVHHGQGTQFQFYDDPRVLYFSLHRYDFGDFWPNLRESDFDFIGEKQGKGYNINIPLNKTGFGNSEYAAAFFNILYPIAYEYQPQLIVISSGYDSAIGCFEGRMKVTPAAYAHFINQLSSFSASKLCVLLEGGYCIKSLSEGVAMSVRGLLGYPCPRIETFEKPDPVYVQTLLNLMACLRPYWKCLQGLNGVDTSLSLEKYLSNWDEAHRKDRKYFDLKNKPETYPLTGFYPLYSDDENARLDKVIDEIIETTDLSVPQRKLCSAGWQAEGCELVGDFETAHDVPQLIAERKFTNGIIVLHSADFFDEFIRTVPETARKASDRIKKVLNVSFTSHDLSEKIKSFDESTLSVVLGGKSGSNHASKYRLNLKFDDLAGYLTSLIKIILPTSYHFNPDLVIVSVDGSFVQEACKSSNAILVEQYLRMLSSLANGNLILIIENEAGLAQSSFDWFFARMVAVLNGEKCTLVPPLVADEKARKSIYEVMETLKPHWDCFQYNEKLPAN